MATKAAPHITREDLARYEKLEAQRKSLGRQARDLAKQADKIEAKMAAFVRVHGGKTKSVTRCGYLFALEQLDGKVEWKTEFIAVAGLKKAEKLIKAAPKREALRIEKL